MKIPDIVQRELDLAPGRWELEEGRKHIHLRVDGRLTAILSKNGGWDGPGVYNIRASIRRALKAVAA